MSGGLGVGMPVLSMPPSIADMDRMLVKVRENNRRLVRARRLMALGLGIWFIVMGATWLVAVWRVCDAIEARVERQAVER